MKKLAIFVEGQTEQIFIRKLLEEIIGRKYIRIESWKTSGGATAPRRVVIIEAAGPLVDQRYFALIVDCGSDSRVGSEIREAYDKLVASGYTAIVGVRDVYPKRFTDIPAIHTAMYYRMPTQPFRPEIVLATMEVEAWFLAEHSHFERIDVTLTRAAIKAGVGFDIPVPDVEARPWPSDDLNRIYTLAGKRYNKAHKTVQRTVEALDYAALYLNLPDSVPSLRRLITLFNFFFTSDTAAPNSMMGGTGPA